MPGGLANTTGIFRQNVDFLSSVVSAAVSGPPCDQQLLPFGPPDQEVTKIWIGQYMMWLSDITDDRRYGTRSYRVQYVAVALAALALPQ